EERDLVGGCYPTRLLLGLTSSSLQLFPLIITSSPFWNQIVNPHFNSPPAAMANTDCGTLLG
ncbi:unnamed protein product, partial [Linum tenue]